MTGVGICYQLPAKFRDALSLDLIPAAARREHSTWHVKQIRRMCSTKWGR